MDFLFNKHGTVCAVFHFSPTHATLESMTEMKIPVVEIGHLLNASNTFKLSGKEREAAMSLRQAFEEYGVAYLRIDKYNNDFAQNAIKNAISAAQKLFYLPDSSKAEVINIDKRPGITRGFLPVGSESGSDLYERKEAFSYSFDWENVEENPSNALEALNAWPKGFSARGTMERYYKLCGDIMAVIARALAMTMNDIDSKLEQVVRDGEKICLMRCIRYLCASSASQARETGSVPHTDWGFATLIAQSADSKPALQVFCDDEYSDVAPVPGTFVINCGDYASLITSGRLRSPLHRVILTDMERYSLVYFSYPAFSTPMPRNTANLHGLSLYNNQAQEAVSIRDDITFGELILHKWEQVQRSTECSADS